METMAEAGSFCLMPSRMVTVLVGVDQRWRFGSLAMGLGSAVLPYATLAFEKHAVRHGLLAGAWRLRQERPRNPFESMASVVMRWPVPSGAFLVLLIAGVFTGLVSIGPPTEWFG